MKKHEIEEKLQKIYEFMQEYSLKNGFPPSMREIRDVMNIKSTATVYDYINRLKNKGLIEKLPQKKRAIIVPSAKQGFRSVPLVGSIKAGSPNFAYENLEGYYPLPPEFKSGDCTFALRVDGESMINVGIFDKDIIIVRQQNTAINGEIVVALIDDSATVKTFYKRDGKVILHPENDTMQDMVFDNVQILGVVKGLYRKI